MRPQQQFPSRQLKGLENPPGLAQGGYSVSVSGRGMNSRSPLTATDDCTSVLTKVARVRQTPRTPHLVKQRGRSRRHNICTEPGRLMSGQGPQPTRSCSTYRNFRVMFRTPNEFPRSTSCENHRRTGQNDRRLQIRSRNSASGSKRYTRWFSRSSNGAGPNSVNAGWHNTGFHPRMLTPFPCAVNDYAPAHTTVERFLP